MTSRILSSRSALVVPLLAVLGVVPTLAPAEAAAPKPRGSESVHQVGRPLVLGHRGASGYRPEHTLAAYTLAVEQGADYIEPDLVSTSDGVLVARHENEISGTTDVELHPEFADRRATKVIDGKTVTGWFTEDFTLAELKTLRAEERIPGTRPANTSFNGQFEVPTLEEVVQLARMLSRQTGRRIGIAPETKHPSYFDAIGLSLEEPLVATLRRHDLDDANDRAVIQSFETTNLKELDTLVETPLVQLVDAAGGAPYDQVLAGTGVTNASLLTDAGLRGISEYADWVSPYKMWVIGRTATNQLAAPTDLTQRAHAVGLPVVIWTMRAENQFLPAECRVGTDPNAIGDLGCEVSAYLDAGVDAFFTDHPDLGVTARDAWMAARP